MKTFLRSLLVAIVMVGIVLTIRSLLGAGGFKRMVTITGVYSICKPDGYDTVCFLDADSKQGGLFCMPLSAVGGECTK